MKSSSYIVLLLVTMVFSATAATTTFFGPVLYQQRSQSPFYAGIQSGSIYVEDFEVFPPQAQNVIIEGGSLAPQEHGVDEDDGIVDGIGINRVWYHFPSFPTPISPFSFEVTFLPNAEGELPKYAGFAILGSVLPSEVGLYFKPWWAFDSEGNPLTAEPLQVELLPLPESGLHETGADQFVGVYHSTGISRLLITGPRLDHLQYGYSIPEPVSIALWGATALALSFRRRGFFRRH